MLVYTTRCPHCTLCWKQKAAVTMATDNNAWINCLQQSDVSSFFSFNFTKHDLVWSRESMWQHAPLYRSGRVSYAGTDALHSHLLLGCLVRWLKIAFSLLTLHANWQTVAEWVEWDRSGRFFSGLGLFSYSNQQIVIPWHMPFCASNTFIKFSWC